MILEIALGLSVNDCYFKYSLVYNWTFRFAKLMSLRFQNYDRFKYSYYTVERMLIRWYSNTKRGIDLLSRRRISSLLAAPPLSPPFNFSSPETCSSEEEAATRKTQRGRLETSERDDRGEKIPCNRIVGSIFAIIRPRIRVGATLHP